MSKIGGLTKIDVTMRRGAKNCAESRGQKRFSSHGDPFRDYICFFCNFGFLYFLNFVFFYFCNSLFLTENVTISRIWKNDAERTGQSDFRAMATHFVNIFMFLLIFKNFGHRNTAAARGHKGGQRAYHRRGGQLQYRAHHRLLHL